MMKVAQRFEFENKADAMGMFFTIASDYRMIADFGRTFVNAETTDKEYLLQYREIGKCKYVVRLLKEEL